MRAGGADGARASTGGGQSNAGGRPEGRRVTNAFCPSCGATPLTAFAAKAPVADVHCGVCAEDDELRAARGRTDARTA
ncbi:MAG: hypothetical protein B7Y86_12885 [Brevundimonas subvibrioides]|uniref:Uncharacterized protein n=1 Tax=Brevundimonas subvibrioides TaxID=74313 RepID=A0A258HFM0_9CAUL|nr:MAG: hypothetical protein B7Y86_12885 [Brevundimonas subvibrioides]